MVGGEIISSDPFAVLQRIERVAKKHGRDVGRVAVARAMLKAIYAMLTKQEAFRPRVKGTTGQRPGVMVG